MYLAGLLKYFLYSLVPPVDDDLPEDDCVLEEGEEDEQHARQQPHLRPAGHHNFQGMQLITVCEDVKLNDSDPPLPHGPYREQKKMQLITVN